MRITNSNKENYHVFCIMKQIRVKVNSKQSNWPNKYKLRNLLYLLGDENNLN